MAGGRPTKYNQEFADKICARIVEGHSLRKISRDLDFDVSCFFLWMRTHEEFSIQYARAKEEQAETLAEEMLDIADEPIEKDASGRRDSGHVNHNRLRVDTRKWIASKLKPKKYGDSTTLRGDSEAPLNPSVNVILNK